MVTSYTYSPASLPRVVLEEDFLLNDYIVTKKVVASYTATVGTKLSYGSQQLG